MISAILIRRYKTDVLINCFSSSAALSATESQKNTPEKNTVENDDKTRRNEPTSRRRPKHPPRVAVSRPRESPPSRGAAFLRSCRSEQWAPVSIITRFAVVQFTIYDDDAHEYKRERPVCGRRAVNDPPVCSDGET
jgi:hypothetical protein